MPQGWDITAVSAGFSALGGWREALQDTPTRQAQWAVHAAHPELYGPDDVQVGLSVERVAGWGSVLGCLLKATWSFAWPGVLKNRTGGSDIPPGPLTDPLDYDPDFSLAVNFWTYTSTTMTPWLGPDGAVSTNAYWTGSEWLPVDYVEWYGWKDGAPSDPLPRPSGLTPTGPALWSGWFSSGDIAWHADGWEPGYGHKVRLSRSVSDGYGELSATFGAPPPSYGWSGNSMMRVRLDERASYLYDTDKFPHSQTRWLLLFGTVPKLTGGWKVGWL